MNVNTSDELAVRPLTAVIGAEISGVDLSEPLEDQTFEGIRNAVHEHGVVVFRAQSLTNQQLVAFARRFGELKEDPDGKNPEGITVIRRLDNIGADGQHEGTPPGWGSWHADSYHETRPPLFQIDYSVVIPEGTPPAPGQQLLPGEEPGTIGVASMRAAYEALSDEKKKQIEGLRIKTKDPNVTQPLVRTHPVTGRKGLFIGSLSGGFLEIEGMPKEEGQELLRELMDFATQPENGGDKLVHGSGGISQPRAE